MRFEERHSSDQELMEALYLGVAGSHAATCKQCGERLLEMQTQRLLIEREQLPTTDLHPDRLAAQRRAIYEQLVQVAEPSGWFGFKNLKLISATAAALVLASGLFVYQQDQQQHRQQAEARQQDTISDAELAREVSLLSQNTEAAPAEPLQALFE